MSPVMSIISAIQYPRNLWNDLMGYRTLGIPPPSEVNEAQMKWLPHTNCHPISTVIHHESLMSVQLGTQYLCMYPY